MRQDQYEKLQALSERLTDVFLDEAEPDKWPGHGIEVGAMDQKTRGDRYWCKKNAVGTMALIGRITHLTNQIRMQGAADLPLDPETAGDDGGLDAEVTAAEREAAKYLDQIQKSSKKAAFDKHVHGKK